MYDGYLFFSKSQKISFDGLSDGEVDVDVEVIVEVLKTKFILMENFNNNIWSCRGNDWLKFQWNS
jgi:hypothetical protein